MLGKIRASSCPVESLERPPSKILKDDSLSIYEATIMKLKLGSKRNPSPCSNEVGEIDASSTSSSPGSEPMKIEVDCASSGTLQGCIEVAGDPQVDFMALDTDCSSLSSSTSSSDRQSMGTSKHQRSTKGSVLYLFSRFKRAQDDICSSFLDAMTTESASISPSSSACQSLSSTEQQLEQECIDSFPVATYACSELGLGLGDV